MALTLELDMIEILKQTTSDKAKQVALIPIIRQDAVKLEFGQRCVDEILDRMDQGIDKNSKNFKAYSKNYIKSFQFEAFNKSKSRVNLELTGDMKSALVVRKTTKRGVVLGFSDKENEDKAVGHVNGAGNLPVRDFFGLPIKVQKEIMNQIIKEVNSSDLDEEELIRELKNQVEDSGGKREILNAQVEDQDITYFLEDLE